MPYRRRGHSRHRVNWDQNDGKPGVVYILKNEAFKEDWIKIGQSTRSGHHRARDLNFEAGTGLPGLHACVFEQEVLDCGRAEKEVHRQLARYRVNKEFFRVEIGVAISTIRQVCAEMDAAIRAAQVAEREARRRADEARADEARRAEAIRQANEHQAARQAAPPSSPSPSATPSPRPFVVDNQSSPASPPRDRHAAATQLATSSPVAKWVSIAFGLMVAYSVITVGLQDSRKEAPRLPTPRTANPAPAAASPPPASEVTTPAVHAPPSPVTAVDHQVTQQSRLDQAAERVSRKYPFLATEAGTLARRLIIEERDRLIAAGTPPDVALEQAADWIAPVYEPDR